jgi:hypothetical protein
MVLLAVAPQQRAAADQQGDRHNADEAAGDDRGYAPARPAPSRGT